MRTHLLLLAGIAASACIACGSNNDPQLITDEDATVGDTGIGDMGPMVDEGTPNNSFVDLGRPDLGECSPEREDVPDRYFFDANCDGIDGDVEQSVFVATYGDDMNPGTKALPKRTVQAAIDTAAQENKSWVLLADGLHEGSIVLEDGIGIAGSYGFGWDRQEQFRTTIRGGNPAIHGADITSPTPLSGFEVEVSELPEPGETVVTILLERSPGVSLHQLMIEGGVGGDGEDGEAGLDGTEGGNGTRGENGEEDSGGLCDSGSRPSAGQGGVNICADANGGNGGRPGKDNDSGDKGDDSALGAVGGDPGPASQPGGNGANGDRGASGQPGAGGAAGGSFSGWDWQGEDGSLGGDGEPGIGGGGGGGGGGGSSNCDSWGGAGGGGGSGGCGGLGGVGGKAGGAGVAVFLLDSDVEIVECTIIGGSGGAGGSGGDGGAGGRGGLGADGGSREDDSGRGGKGGDGGVGGRGGEGGGGAGGPGYAIYSTAALTTEPVNSSVTDGVGGPGGLAASAEGKGAAGEGGAIVIAE